MFVVGHTALRHSLTRGKDGANEEITFGVEEETVRQEKARPVPVLGRGDHAERDARATPLHHDGLQKRILGADVEQALEHVLPEFGQRVVDGRFEHHHLVARGRLHRLADRHGKKVSLIGWSLGGVYARELAKELPDLVRCVITLGSPFGGHPRATNAWRVYEWVSGQSVHDDPVLHEQLRHAPPVPTTSIFSRSDGVVAWHCSVNEVLPHTENVEVAASHVGMGVNPFALYVVADRLRQDPQTWQRFDTSGPRRWFFKQAEPPVRV